MLAHWAKQQPDAPAIVFSDTRRTWSQLRERVQRVVAGLRAAGLQPGDRIAVLDLNYPSCLELTLACALSGCANAVVNFRLAPPEIAYVINDAQARLLFVGPEVAAAAAQLRPQLPSLERVIHIGGDADEYERWLAAHAPDTHVHPTADTDCFLQLYTSGTTGFPKGAMLTHRGMHGPCPQRGFKPGTGRRVTGSGGDALVCPCLPLFHVGGTGYGFLPWPTAHRSS